MTSSRSSFVGVAATGAVQALAWLAVSRGWISTGLGLSVVLAAAWALILFLVLGSSRRIEELRTELEVDRDEHRAARGQVEQLEALNEMLLTLGRSRDVGLAFQALGRRVGRLVPCDRLGLALIKEGSQELQTYSARVSEPERRKRPRPELEYSMDRTLFGQAIRTCEPVLVGNLTEHGNEFHDAGVLASQGFKSALVLPLLSHNRAIGALTVISSRKQAFGQSHLEAMEPLAEVLAFAFLAQQQHAALARFRTMETVAEMTVSLAADINSALQTIIGQGGLLQLQRPELAADVDVIVGQAERISDLLDRMRRATNERLGDAGDTSRAIPASPEAFAEEEDE
jgi:GAF domain-containing protein